MKKRSAARSGRFSSPRIAATGSSPAFLRFHATTPFFDATMLAKIHGRFSYGGGKPSGSKYSGSGDASPKGRRVSLLRCHLIFVSASRIFMPFRIFMIPKSLYLLRVKSRTPYTNKLVKFKPGESNLQACLCLTSVLMPDVCAPVPRMLL